MTKATTRLLCGIFLVLVSLLPLRVMAQEQSGVWTATGEYTYANGTTVDFTGTYTSGNFNNLSVWSAPLAGAASLEAVHEFDSCVTVSFTKDGAPSPQLNPVIHMDRIGGAAGTNPNSARVTLSGTNAYTGAALTWTRLAGTVDFATTSTTAYDLNAESGRPRFTTGESGDDYGSTAAGSVRINGIVTTFQLCYPLIGPRTNVGDGIEYIVFSNPAVPVLAVDKTTTDVPRSTGDTLDYTFTVTNSGNVAGAAVAVSDPRCATGPTYTSGDTNLNGQIEPSETWLYACTSRPLTEAQIVSGAITNTVTVTWGDPSGQPVGSAGDTLVTPVVPRPILADNDALGTVSGSAGGTTSLSALTGDTLDGAQVTTGTVNLSVVSAPSPASGSLTLNPDGTVTVAPGTTAGTYSFTYQICEGLNPANCTTATASVTVSAPVVNAVNDSLGSLDGTGGATTPSVLGNDKIGGAGAAGTVTLTAGTSPLPGQITMNADGTISVAAGTPAGVYSYPYTICDPVNPSNCDTALATFTVFAQPVITLQKALDGNPGRNADTDQFTLTIAGTNGPVSTTTGGTGSGVTGGGVTLTGVAGSAYTLSEAFAGTASAANYNARWSCTNATTGGTVVPAGTGTSLTTPALKGNDVITCTVTNTFVPSADLQTVKLRTSADATPADGDTVTFTITVINNGPATATGVTLSDPLPAGLTPTIANGTVSQGSYAAPTWSVGTLATGASATLTLEGTVGANLGGTVVTNTTTAATSDVPDPTTAGDSLSASVAVEATPGVALIKNGTFNDQSGDGFAQAGETVTYTFTVTNTGNTPFDTFTVTDALFDPDLNQTVTLASPLLQGQSAQISADYTLTQADVDFGLVINTAAASLPDHPGVRDSSGSTNFNNTPTTVTLPQDTELALDKRVASGGLTSFSAVGQVLTYDFVVTNTGSTSITDPISISDDTVTTAATCPALPAGGLAPGASVTCTGASYGVTQADLDAGGVTNVATATDGSVTSAADTLVIPAIQAPAMSIVKTSDYTGASYAQGVVVNYSFEVTNTGNVTLSDPISVVDNVIGTVSCPDVDLAPGDSLTCTAAYTLTNDDASNGEVVNTAYATDGTTDSPTTSLRISNGTDPDLTLTKSVVSGDPYAAVGDEIVFGFSVFNSGDATFNNQPIEIVDPLFGTFTCFAPGGGDSFDPGETVTCQSPAYTVTQADLDAGSLTNTATAQGTITGGGGGNRVIRSAPDSATATADPTLAPELTVAKVALTADGGAVGDTVDYQITVTNTGDLTVSNVSVSDPLLPSLGCTPVQPASLAPAQSITCTGSIVLRQADVDAGAVLNTASAAGLDPSGADVTATSAQITYTPAAQDPDLNLVKTGAFNDGNGNGAADAGETITYTFTVTNTGNVTLTDVTLSDPALTPDPVVTYASLAPGAVRTVTGAYTITQGDIDGAATDIANQATLTGVAPLTAVVTDGSSPTDTGDATDAGTPTLVPLPRDPELALIKTASYVDANGNGVRDLGDRIDFGLTVANTGSVTVTDLVVSDVTLGLTSAPLTLAPGASLTLSDPALSYALTQADIDAGQVQNTASATGNDNFGAPITQPSNTVTVPLPSVPAMAVVKSGVLQAGADGIAQAGETILYTFTVTNTGNVTLTNAQISDPVIGAGVVATVPGPILPGGSAVATVSLTLTQAMIDAGLVENIATAIADGPGGTTATDTSGTTNANNAPTVTPLGNAPALSLVKAASLDTGADAIANAGDTITYTFTVTNTGNTSLYDIDVTDAALTPTLVGTIDGPLAPGATGSLTATYTVTQADMDAGAVVNSALATGRDALGGSASDTSGTDEANDTPTTVALAQTPAMVLVKSGTLNDANGSGRADLGDTITYTFTVMNTGSVSLRDIAVTDPDLDPTLVGTVSGPLAPGESATVTGVYDVTQADLDAGQAVNQATVAADDPTGAPIPTVLSGTATDNTDPTVTPLPQAPSIFVDKRLAAGAPRSYATAGVVLSYQIVVTNTGNVTITTPVTIDDPLTSDETCPALPAGGLVPGASLICTASYTTTQADVNAGSVQNTATITAGALTGSDSVTVPGIQTPALTLTKSAPSISALIPGQTVTYSYLVENTGNVTLAGPFTVTDDRIATVSCPSGPLAPGATLTCTGTYVITLSDLELGSITNNASVTANGTTSPSDSVTIPEATNPALSLDKTILSVNGVPGNTLTAAGDLIRYRFTITNTGTGTFVRDIEVTDSLLGTTFVCWEQAASVPNYFAPGAVATCTASYVATQADLDRGSVYNEAKAQSVYAPASSTPLTVVSPVDPAVAPVAAAPALTLVKTATPVAGAAVGQTVTYTLRATNSGNQTISGVAIDDPMLPALACAPAQPTTLAPGDVLTCSGIYLVTQADVNAEEIVNTASTSGTSPSGATVSDDATLVYVPQTPRPALAVVKTGALIDTNGNGVADAGEVIRYTLVTTNTGNQTLTSVTVSDPMLTPNPLATYATLAPGAVRSVTADFTVTQALLDSTAVAVVNQATASALDPDSASVSDLSGATRSDDRPTATPLARDPVLTLDKTAVYADTNGNGLRDAGDTVRYTIVVRNDGNTTISGISVDDPLAGGVIASGLTLLPGASVTLTPATVPALAHVVTQAEADALSVTNTATATGSDSQGASLAASDSTTTALPKTPAVALVKSAALTDTNGNGLPDAGEPVVFTFTVTNTGTVSLRGIEVTDALLSPTLAGTIAGPLAPGATATVTASYPLTQADIDAGRVVNTATATGRDPQGATVSDVSGSAVTNDDPTVTPLLRDPDLTLDKRAVSPVTFDAPGQTISYAFDVTNTGNVTSGATIRVDDSLLPLAVTCPAGPLAPGAMLTCTGTYVTTQEDVDAGGVTNTATASDGRTTSNADTVFVPADQSPALTIDKTSDWVAGTPFNPGTIITYSYLVTNTGNTTIETLQVVDNKVATVSCAGFAPLAPGESHTCEGAYVVTAGDVALGRVTNNAYATDGTTRSPGDSVTVPTGLDPVLTLTKTADVTTFDTLGQVVTYTYAVQNTGDVAFVSDIVIDDDIIGRNLCEAHDLSNPFNTGQTATCQFPYEITQADLDRGSVTNVAVAETIFAPASGSSETVQSPADSVTVTAVPLSLLTVDKAVLTAAGGGLGDVVSYAITATNEGNQTLTSVTLADPLLPALTCTPAQPLALAPGASVICTGDYRLTQGDIDAGEVLNIAAARGFSPDSSLVEGSDDAAYTTETGAPALSLAKTGVFVDTDLDGLAQAGEIVRFAFTLRNSGNQTLTDVSVTDDLLDPALIVAGLTLAPGETRTVLRDYVVTQDDVDAGEVVNTATASGLDPDLLPVTDLSDPTGTADAPTVVPLVQDPGLSLTKTAAYVDQNGTGATDLGDTIDYTLTITNTGNTRIVDGTLRDVTLSPDPLLTGLTLGVGEVLVLTPADLPILTYALTQADLDAAERINSATVSGLTQTGETPSAAATVVTPLDPVPSVSLVKSGTYVDADDSGSATLGDRIDYAFAVLNDGVVTLSGVEVTDPPVGAVSCTPAAPAVLSPGAAMTCTASYAVTQADIDAGEVLNTATVAGETPQGASVSDTSGTAADNDDPTVVALSQVPGFTLAKTGVALDDDDDGLVEVGETARYSFTVTNTGNTSLSDIQISDPLLDNPYVGAVAGPLAPGESATLTADYTLTAADAAAGVIDNTATAGVVIDGALVTRSATHSLGINLPPVAADDTLTGLPTNTPVTVSVLANDSDPDGDALDPASVRLLSVGLPDDVTLSEDGRTLTVPGQGTWTVDAATGDITFTPEDGFTADPSPVAYTVQDDGGLTSLPALVTLDFAIQPPVAADDTLISTTPGAPVTIDILGNDADPDGRLNPATVRLVDAEGDGRLLVVPGQGSWTVDPATGALTFTPEDGFAGTPDPVRYIVSDNDGNLSNEATVTIIYGEPELTVDAAITGFVDVDGDAVPGPGDLVTYAFTVTNTGDLPMTNVTALADILPGLMCEPVSLLPGESAELSCTGNAYALTPSDIAAGEVTLIATAIGTDPNGAEVASINEVTLVQPVATGGVRVAKQVTSGSNARAGDLVRWEVTVTNLSPALEIVVDVLDRLPEGLLFQKGSATVGGVAVTAVAEGRRIRFEDVVVPGGATVTLGLQSFVTGGARPGAYTNRAQALNPLTGAPVSNEAEATVIVAAEPVFDCGTVVGRVFDDLNGDGYQNDAPRGLITDQTTGGKSKRDVSRSPAAERGIAGARLVTPDGKVIRTDENGLYSVPCAALPGAQGQTFLLKLDPRSLPSGYRLTTENPRAVRLTAGKMTELNFGARQMRVVDVGLAARAFDANGRPGAQLRAGLAQLVTRVADSPSVVVLTYSLSPSETPAEARRRLRAVTAELRRLWPANGRYRLTVEQKVVR